MSVTGFHWASRFTGLIPGYRGKAFSYYFCVYCIHKYNHASLVRCFECLILNSSHQNSHMKPWQRSVNVYSTAHQCISPPYMHAHTGRALASIPAFMEMLPNSRRGQLKCVTPGEERERMSKGEEPASIITLKTVFVAQNQFYHLYRMRVIVLN